MGRKHAGQPGLTFHFTIQTRPAVNLVVDTPIVDPVGRRVLIVDDNHTNCVILRELLRRWGIEPTCRGKRRSSTGAT